MILTDKSRAKGAATRAAAQAVRNAERTADEQAKADAIEAVERAFPVKCSVQINQPKDRTRHMKFGKVVEINSNTKNIEIGVRVNVENPRGGKAAKEERTGISAWYLPSELIRALPPKH